MDKQIEDTPKKLEQRRNQLIAELRALPATEVAYILAEIILRIEALETE